MGFAVGSLVLFLLLGGVFANGIRDLSFDRNYKITWGYDHVLNQGTEIQLSMDKISGAGFESKLSFGSGFFHMKIKVPAEKVTTGVVTAFYLTSKGGAYNDAHDEVDLEFLGSDEGKPISLQTNVFVNDLGGREQAIYLWFDPRADFHYYKILWNQHQIVFFVDDIPIRVFKNKTDIGVNYPSHPMKIEASLWDGEIISGWLNTKVNWSYAPFKSHFQGFDIKGCIIKGSSTDIQPCFSPYFGWNSPNYWKLDFAQQRAYENVKNKYLHYDYCSDRNRYPTPPPECPQ